MLFAENKWHEDWGSPLEADKEKLLMPSSLGGKGEVWDLPQHLLEISRARRTCLVQAGQDSIDEGDRLWVATLHIFPYPPSPFPPGQLGVQQVATAAAAGLTHDFTRAEYVNASLTQATNPGHK